MSPNQVPGSTYVSDTCLPDIDTELTRTAPLATPHQSSAGEPRDASGAPSGSRRTTARDRIAARSSSESLENHGPASMLFCSSIVRIGLFIPCPWGDSRGAPGWGRLAMQQLSSQTG